MSKYTDQELIQGLLTNNTKLVQIFIDQHKQSIYHICLGYVQSHEDAQDLTQEIFVKAIGQIEKFNVKSKLSTWLYRISVNHSLNHLRSIKRRNIFNRLESIWTIEELAYTNVTPEGQMVDDEIKEQARLLIAGLPDNQKTAFILNKYESLSYREIGEVMGLSVSAVESLIFRAKQKILKKISHQREKKK